MKMQERQERIIFLGILIIFLGIVIGFIIKLLTFIAIIIGVYLVVRGLIGLNKFKPNKTKKKK